MPESNENPAYEAERKVFSDLLAAFQEEIAELKEKADADPSMKAHLSRITPAELTIGDAFMWRKVMRYPEFGEVTREEFRAYEKGVAESHNRSRSFLSAYLRNKLMPRWNKDAV